MGGSQNQLTAETIDYAKSVNVYDLARALGIPLERVGRSYFTSCFVHGEKTPSLSIDPEKNRFKCFGSCEDTGGKGGISFYMYYKWGKFDESFFLEAVEDVCYLMGHTVMYRDGTEMKSDRPVQQHTQIEERRDSPLAEPQLITAVYQSLVNKLTLNIDHYHHLLNERKLSPSVIALRQYRSYPERPYLIARDIGEEFTTLEGVPGFYESVKRDDSGTYWNLAGTPGILIPVRDEYGVIQGFQLRVESPKLSPVIKSVEEHHLQAEITDKQVLTVLYKKRLVYSGKVTGSETIPIRVAGQLVGTVTLKKRNKYIWLSSSGRRKGTKAVPTYHVSYPPAGIPDGSTIDCSTVFVTEGPLKGDISSEYIGKPVVSFPGLSQWYLGVEGAMKLNPNRVVIAVDGDALHTVKDKDTDDEREEAGEVIRSLIRSFASEGVSIDLAIWDAKMSSKGIDDLYTSGLKPNIFSVFEV